MVDKSARIPINELDMNFRTIETVWYDGEIPVDVRNALSRDRFFLEKDEKGAERVVGERVADYSQILKLQTRDMRLSNLDAQSYKRALWYQEFASECALMGGLPKSTALCISDRDSILNLRHSSKGWARELLNTFIQRMSKVEDEPKRKKLLSRGSGGVD